MTILQEATKVHYTFRCSKCMSQFEVTKEEREAFNEKYKRDSPTRYFDCPICGDKQSIRHNSVHKLIIMKDGTKYQEY